MVHHSKLNEMFLIIQEIYSVSTGDVTRYPQAYRFLKLKYHIHSSVEKSIVEMTM